MKLIISGKPTKVQLAICRKALRSFAKRLISNRLYKTLTIKVYFVKECPSKAECLWNDEPYRGKSYTMNIRKTLSSRETLLCLAHEMVHVAQWATGALRDFWNAPDKCTWKGKPFTVNDDGYFFYPWEIEAYGLEVGLYYTFKKEQRYGIQKPRFKRT